MEVVTISTQQVGSSVEPSSVFGVLYLAGGGHDAGRLSKTRLTAISSAGVIGEVFKSGSKERRDLDLIFRQAFRPSVYVLDASGVDSQARFNSLMSGLSERDLSSFFCVSSASKVLNPYIASWVSQRDKIFVTTIVGCKDADIVFGRKNFFFSTKTDMGNVGLASVALALGTRRPDTSLALRTVNLSSDSGYSGGEESVVLGKHLLFLSRLGSSINVSGEVNSSGNSTFSLILKEAYIKLNLKAAISNFLVQCADRGEAVTYDDSSIGKVVSQIVSELDTYFTVFNLCAPASTDEEVLRSSNNRHNFMVKSLTVDQIRSGYLSDYNAGRLVGIRVMARLLRAVESVDMAFYVMV